MLRLLIHIKKILFSVPILKLTLKTVLRKWHWFSQNHRTGPIWSSSCNVRLCDCVFVYLLVCPLPMQFFYSSHWPSHHMISAWQQLSSQYGPKIDLIWFPTCRLEEGWWYRRWPIKIPACVGLNHLYSV